MAAANSPALPVFSYAQAAKGLAPASSATPPQAEPSVNIPDMQTERKASIPQAEKLESLCVVPGPGRGVEPLVDQRQKMDREDVNVSSTVKPNSDKPVSSATKKTSSPHCDSKQVSQSTSPSLVASLPTLPREDEYSSTINGSSESWDKQSETSATADRSAPVTESGKEKNGEEDWVNVPAPKVEKEQKELREAPIPAVNFWQQRQEAQRAKAEANATVASRSSAPLKSKPSAQSGGHVDSPAHDTKRKPSGKLADKGDVVLKKQQDSTKITGRDDDKRQPRQGRASEPDMDITEPSSAPPPVGDPASWPTPETANHDKKKPQDKGDDKVESKSPGMKANQRWYPVPHVFTAKFDTQFPSRRGGRSTRGPGANRGSHVSQGSTSEKTEKTRSTAAPPIPKQIPEQQRGGEQRGRDQQKLNSSRATSAPTRRAASVGPEFAEQQGMTKPAQFENKRHATSEQHGALGDPLSPSNEEEGYPNKWKPDSKPFSRQSSLSYRTRAPRSGESHAHPRYTWHTQAGSDGPGDASRPRDAKAESWRDREVGGERSEPRHGRGRGGFRARGHSTYAGAQSHAFTAPLPQQPFSAGKPPALGERHRQATAPYAGMPPPTNQRVPSRSQSIATHSVYTGIPNNLGSPLSPVQTDVNGVVGGYASMYPGIMSAVPYSAALEPMDLVFLVSAQLNYYFSVDNLCKDMYLRSHMDSQGWVPLTVIAGFNRIKALTKDMNLIRHVCQVTRTIEFRPGEDGADRLRKLDEWEQWVLDIGQRQAHAQSDGPPPLERSQSPAAPSSIFPSMSQTTSPTWISGPFYTGYADAASFGVAGPPSEDQSFSAQVSGNLPDIPTSEDFSLIAGQAALISPSRSTDALDSAPPIPTQNVSTNNPSPGSTSVNIMNGHPPAISQEIGVENVFSNERMNELHVCVRHPTNQYSPPFISSATRTFSHGSIDGLLPGSAQIVNPMPSLRGGAGSPEGFGRVEDQLTSVEKSTVSDDRGVFWMKDGTPPDSWIREGSTSERYQSLHDRALAERTPGMITDDMDWLYQFWSHFLVRNFNFDMYKDFRALAWEDAAAGHEGGLNHLRQYYGAILTGPRVLSEQLTADIVKLAETEPSDKRQTFYQLRSALRDEALNLKTRSMIHKFLSPQLEAELER